MTTPASDRRLVSVRVALIAAILLAALGGIARPGAAPIIAAALVVLVASVRWRVETAAIAVLFASGIGLRLAMLDGVGSDVLLVTRAAIERMLAGENPYGVGYLQSLPQGAPFPYGPLALFWYVPVRATPVVAELLAAGLILGAMAVRRRVLGLAIYATAPVLVQLTTDGSNDTSAGLLILAALAMATHRPVVGAAILGLAVAFKPYALAWAPPLVWWAGPPAAAAFLGVSLVAWSPVLLAWGAASFLHSLELSAAIHKLPYFSLGSVWEGLLGRPAPAELLERGRLVLGGLTALVGLRFATSLDRVILAGTATFLVTLYAGYWSTFAYIAALAPILCWRIDDWLTSPGARAS